MRRLVIAVSDPSVAGRVRALAQESGRIEVVDLAADSDQVTAALNRHELDAVLVHEDLGPLPPLELIRQLSAKHPGVGFLLLAREGTPEVLRAALRAGARDVVPLPLSVEAVSEAVESAAQWASAVRTRIDDQEVAQVAGRIGGRILVVAGAKGGVGTTTIATHLAVAAAKQDQDRPVCLVELDLQAGDVRALLDVSSRRSIADLAAVADEVTVRSLDDTLYVHPSGLRVLLSPDQGEDGEDLTAEAMRRILAALKFQYDLVVCDVGATLGDATAIAVELANDVLVVATPDVPALRGANRLLALWERLQVRTDGIRIVLNRTHKETEIQPEFAERVLNAPVVSAHVPSGFRELEAAANTGDLERADSGDVPKALAQLAEEVGAVAPPERRRRLRLRPRAATAESGQISVELVGLTLIICVLVLGMVQAVLAGYTAMLAGDSARAGARAFAVSEPARVVEERALHDLPGTWRRGAQVEREQLGVRVSLVVPMVIPFVSDRDALRITDRKRTVVEGKPLPSSYEPAAATTGGIPQP